MAIPIIYEDEALLLVNKACNLLVHHSHYARNIRESSLVEQLRDIYQQQIYTIHRLDRKTSGIMVFAKDKITAKNLQQQFENRIIQKTYLALVRGHVMEEGVIDSPIKSDQNKEYKTALTHYTPIEIVEFNKAVNPYNTARYTLLQLKPQTGRMHQLRKHMNKFAHPIIGDPKYGNRHHNHAFQQWFGHASLFLHAHEMIFNHPQSNTRMKFKASLPDFWKENLRSLGFKATLERF